MKSLPRQHSKEQPKIIGTGLIALDLVISADPTLPVRSWAGGTCGNVLTILSFLGWNAFPIARLNGDAASLRIKADFERWGVHLNYTECSPTSSAPIIVQKIHRTKAGEPRHKFSWVCPNCGTSLPGFRAVPTTGAQELCNGLPSSQVFFMDRLSRSALALAKSASAHGALIFYEPSGKPDPSLLREALDLVHIVKYSDQRLKKTLIEGEKYASPGLLEIQTLGHEGLQYRSRLPKARTRDWRQLEAFRIPKLVDACGAGDWSSAGLISKIGRKGLSGFKEVGQEELREALCYGQALGAWNCGFEGARGGMYHVNKAIFERQVGRILNGKPVSSDDKTNPANRILEQIKEATRLAQVCPACP